MNIGKRGKEWLRVRKAWINANPPDHQGYYLCGICLRPVHFSVMELDHINGRLGERLSNLDDLQPTHGRCNQEKGSKKGIANVSKAEALLRRQLDL